MCAIWLRLRYYPNSEKCKRCALLLFLVSSLLRFYPLSVPPPPPKNCTLCVELPRRGKAMVPLTNSPVPSLPWRGSSSPAIFFGGGEGADSGLERKTYSSTCSVTSAPPGRPVARSA